MGFLTFCTALDHLKKINRIYLYCPVVTKKSTTGLEAYFFSHSQTFASGFNFNSQIAVSNSQLVFPTFEQF